jgi:hypothetical protein
MQRFQVAKQWLNGQNPHAKIPDPYAMPHSPEWFEALNDWNPYQAQATRIFVEHGGPEVCSMCGDEQAPIYKIDERIPPRPGSVATLRLCDDCREICALRGEHFVPFAP